MSKGDGGGVNIVFGGHGLPATGEKRRKLTQATEIDAHLTQKFARNAAQAKLKKEQVRSRASKAEQQADKLARARYREAPKEVIVEQRVGGEVQSTRKIKRS
jgi:hypothetical protein